MAGSHWSAGTERESDEASAAAILEARRALDCAISAPAAVAAIPVSLLFGAVAVSKGCRRRKSASCRFWYSPAARNSQPSRPGSIRLPILTLAFATFLINARHILMGASLSPKLAMSRSREIHRVLLPHRRGLGACPKGVPSNGPLPVRYWCAMSIALYVDMVDRQPCSARSSDRFSGIPRASVPISPLRLCSSA